MYTLPDAPLSVQQVLDHGLRLFRACFSRVFPVALVGALSSATFTLLMDMPQGELPDFTADLVIGWVVAAVIGVCVAVTIIVSIDRIAKGDDVPLSGALGVAASRAIPFSVVGVLYSVVTGLGFLLLLVPGVLLSVSLSMAFYAVVVDGMGPIESLRHSHRLVWGDWWRTAGVLSLVVGIIVVVYVLLVGAGALAIAIFGLPGVPEMTKLARLIVGPALNAVFAPLTYSFGLVIYNDLKLRRERGGVAAPVPVAEGG